MIIKNDDGRAHSSRTREENEELLHHAYTNLTPAEQKVFDAYLRDTEEGEDFIVSMLAEHRYRWKPVSMDQFLEDPYYLGVSCKTVYPKIKEDLIELFSAKYREVILTGSIGWGKTTFASIAMIRLIYELSCLLEPQLAFGMSPGSEMIISLVSKNLHLARSVLKSAIDDKLLLSGYFEQQFKASCGRDTTTFPSNLQFSIASYGSERLLGVNVYSAALDEANFAMSRRQQISTGYGTKRTVANYDSAEKVYGSLLRRIKSRFQRSGGDLPGLILLISSAATVGSFLDRRIDAAKDDSSVFIRDYATWDVKPDKDFSGEKFRVLCGNSSLRSRILEEEENVPEDFVNDNDGRMLHVPEEYRTDFEQDLENAIRDVAGISTHAISAFMQRIEMIDECIVAKKHPFTAYEWQYGSPGQFMWDKLARVQQRRLPGGFTEDVWIPLEGVDKMRHVHIDTSLSGDSTGICMGHIDRWVDVVRRSPNGDTFTDQAPYVVIDFMLKVNPPYGEQIYLPDMRRLVYELMEHGFSIGGFTCDTYQSAEMLQQMKRKGVNAYILSVDGDMLPYDSLKSAIYEKRIEFYKYKPFISELKALEIDRERNKVDHPLAGSKDVSDAVAGVIAGLVMDAKRLPIYLDSDNVIGDEDPNDTRWVSRNIPVESQGSDFKHDPRDLFPFIMGDD